ncbi:Exc2 family lipoprotein [Providencia rettgeri]|uniref:Exc2 family lipoprotein n=1 Tax=Providencia rettgeri TaxID=587 RepID=UPI003D2D0D2F
MFKIRTALLTSAIFMVLSCNSNKMPYEKISEHYVYRITDYQSDPNFQTNIHTTVKLNIPFFKQFFELGIEDKNNKISEADHEKRIDYLSSEEFINSLDEREQFISEKVHVETKSSANRSNAEKKILKESILAAYNAGYSSIK